MTASRHQKVCALLAACSALPAMPARAEQGALMTAGPTLFVSDDNEHFQIRRTGIDFYPLLKEGDAVTGLRYVHSAFRADAWSRSADQLAFVSKGQLAEGVRAWQFDAGILAQDGRTLLTLDTAYHLPISKTTSAEFFINRDFVETAGALDQGIHFTYAGGSIEHQFHPKFALVALAGYQQFNDDNRRVHARIKAIYQPSLDLGLTFQYRYRYYDSTPNETRRAYFNPEHYRENMLLAGWRHRSHGWVSSILAGVGEQTIIDSPKGPTRLLEVAVDSPAAGSQVLGLRAGYLQTASFGGPNYRYHYLQANWTLRF